jgi:isoleucyl-tRNA synthetase
VKAKPNFPRLGKRAGKDMKALAASIAGLDRETLFALQGGATTTVQVADRAYELDGEDVVLETLSVEGLEAASDGVVTIGLVTEITPELAREGLARELLNRIQNQRRDSGLEVSDRVRVRVTGDAELRAVVDAHGAWIAEEVLAPSGIEWSADAGADARDWELREGLVARVGLHRVDA